MTFVTVTLAAVMIAAQAMIAGGLAAVSIGKPLAVALRPSVAIMAQPARMACTVTRAAAMACATTITTTASIAATASVTTTATATAAMTTPLLSLGRGDERHFTRKHGNGRKGHRACCQRYQDFLFYEHEASRPIG
jgi:hypothetical protein